jgi:hypothetical protein
MSDFTVRTFDKVGCFRVGLKVYRGNGRKMMTITALQSINNGPVRATLNKGVSYRLEKLSLAGPNGEGE